MKVVRDLRIVSLCSAFGTLKNYVSETINNHKKKYLLNIHIKTISKYINKTVVIKVKPNSSSFMPRLIFLNEWCSFCLHLCLWLI